ncbi:MAG: 16S rRNA (cytidine(1402)-2'-O)-methyltransferase [Clostridia bacterium]|jgi:16S rRNA (cytidine1402-2'-O)-methyltransferase|nr:16S rRNA (cytidine(1402)-2'-O)-methyltransferase [Clostridia bacterium]
MEKPSKGRLFLVGTPIGNLGDITLRALETLKTVDLIAAEDTRQTQKLLTHYAIHQRTTSYFEHNKKQKGAALLEELLQGKTIALVSDAGMPGISDPGSDLVQACLAREIPVTVIPGPSALLTGLVASGLDTDSFVFAGFFPRVMKEKKALLTELARERRTIVFYESPHRLGQTLADIGSAWGDRPCCVARELTKIYEEYQRGTLSEVRQYFAQKTVKGEITLMIAGCRDEGVLLSWEEIESKAAALLESGLSKKEAAKTVAEACGVSRRELYNRIVRTDK